MAAPTGKFFKGPKDNSDRETVFIVEGIDDAFFLDRLLVELNADSISVGIIYLEGKNKLDLNLRSFCKSSQMVQGVIKKYCLILDADADAGNTVRQTHAILKRHAQPQPEHGAIAAGSVSVGLFIIPSGGEDGNLEKLLLSTIQTDQKFIFVEKFFGDVQASFEKLDEPYKRLSRIYLDCCPGHHRGAGRAFNSGSFDSIHASLAPLREFVKKMIHF